MNKIEICSIKNPFFISQNNGFFQFFFSFHVHYFFQPFPTIFHSTTTRIRHLNSFLKTTILMLLWIKSKTTKYCFKQACHMFVYILKIYFDNGDTPLWFRCPISRCCFFSVLLCSTFRNCFSYDNPKQLTWFREFFGVVHLAIFISLDALLTLDNKKYDLLYITEPNVTVLN